MVTREVSVLQDYLDKKFIEIIGFETKINFPSRTVIQNVPNRELYFLKIDLKSRTTYRGYSSSISLEYSNVCSKFGLVLQNLYKEYKKEKKTARVYCKRSERKEYIAKNREKLIQELGNFILQEYERKNCYLTSIPKQDGIKDIFKASLLIEDNTEYNEKLLDKYHLLMNEVIEEYLRLEAEIIAGLVDDPVQAIINFKEKHLGGTK